VTSELVAWCRLAGQWLVVDVRRRDDSLGQVLDAEMTSVSAVVGRRDLPSRGLPRCAALSLKRCRVITPPRRPADLSVQSDDEHDRNKENRRPDWHVRRRRVDCDASLSGGRCAIDGRQQSPDNHVYDTLEPTSSDDAPTSDDVPASPIYATIDSEETLNASLTQRRRHRASTMRQQHDSACHKTKKRVTFNVSLHSHHL